MIHIHDLSLRLIHCIAPTALIASSLAVLAPEPAHGQVRVQRSTADVRERPRDELDRPRDPERWTHRGFEVRTDQFFVVANTRVEDARWAAEQMKTAWDDFGRLADAWMKEHRHQDFGIGSVQVYIDANAPKARDLPWTTLNVVGSQTQITLHVGSGQPKLEDQLYRLRKGAGQAFLHTAELDQKLPPWACDGLASYVAAEGLSAAEVTGTKQWSVAKDSPRLGGQQWRFQRAQQDRLNVAEFDEQAAAQKVEFLLTAQDAEHATTFFAAIKESIAVANRRRNQEIQVAARRGQTQSAALGPVDHLAHQLAKPFADWQKAPLGGQPVLEIDATHSQELERAKREMAVAMKLAQRFSVPEQKTLRTRIIAFDKQKGMTDLSRQSDNTPVSMFELYQRLGAPQQPLWGTLNAEGKLVLSSDGSAIRALLGVDDHRYHWEVANGRGVLTTNLDGQWKLQGWLEENHEDPSRPLAKFTATKLAERR